MVCLTVCVNPFWSYRASPAVWDHTELPATQHNVMWPYHNPNQTDWYLIYLL